jgi:two-component system, chemotaxis family, response regulator PixH
MPVKGDSMRILYLEDSELDAKLVQQYMKSVQHVFDSVRTIDQAQQYLSSQKPDVFLVDIVIGGETAHDLIKQVVKQRLSKHIVAVTAKALPSERKQYMDLGCDRVLAKPFTIDDLEQTLEVLSQE